MLLFLIILPSRQISNHNPVLPERHPFIVLGYPTTYDRCHKTSSGPVWLEQGKFWDSD
jgi:hypothetical protein